MSEPKDPPEEPLQLEIDWLSPAKEDVGLGVVYDPDDFDLGVHDGVEHQGVVLLFPKSKHGILFEGLALQKLLFLFDTLLHNLLESSSPGAGEAPREKKKVTLH